MDEKFFYIRDYQRRPIITGCHIQDGNRNGLGLALCSCLDQPSKKIGRAIAKGRALTALKEEKTSRKISNPLNWDLMNIKVADREDLDYLYSLGHKCVYWEN